MATEIGRPDTSVIHEDGAAVVPAVPPVAAEERRSDPPLVRVLFDEAYRFEFFQAVRLLERIYSDRRPVGVDAGATPEIVRFHTLVSLNFPASPIYRLTRAGADDPERPAQMTLTFMGLIGPQGVLPHPYTELLLERLRSKDRALWEFLDLFVHRMVSLFYRAWEKHRFPVAYERGEGDRFTEHLYDLIGMGTRGLRGRLGLADPTHRRPDQCLLFYAGLSAQRPHSASTMQAILSDYFGVPAHIEQFVGQWLTLDEDSRSYLGRANSELGVNTVAGARVWENQSKFRLRFGPLPFAKFLSFLPAGPAYRPAGALTRWLAGMEFDFDMQLILKAEEVPSCVLDTRAALQPRLGWTTWLKTRPFTQDDAQTILSVKE